MITLRAYQAHEISVKLTVDFSIKSKDQSP